MKLLLVALLVSGCTAQVTREPVPAHDAAADATVEAEPDITPEPCRCDFHWTNGPEMILCYPRGDSCTITEVCVPVLPLTEQPSCRFRDG